MVVYFQTPEKDPDTGKSIEFRQCLFEGTGPPPPGSRILRACHYKDDKFHAKRKARGGDAITGRGIGLIPTAYDIAKMTANADDLAWMGISEEDAKAMSTQELETRVRTKRQAEIATAAQKAGISADELAAQVAQAEVDLRRQEDPGYSPPAESDWRTQTVLELGSGGLHEVPDSEAVRRVRDGYVEEFGEDERLQGLSEPTGT